MSEIQPDPAPTESTGERPKDRDTALTVLLVGIFLVFAACAVYAAIMLGWWRFD